MSSLVRALPENALKSVWPAGWIAFNWIVFVSTALIVVSIRARVSRQALLSPLQPVMLQGVKKARIILFT